jgi:hypothetical protein
MTFLPLSALNPKLETNTVKQSRIPHWRLVGLDMKLSFGNLYDLDGYLPNKGAGWAMSKVFHGDVNDVWTAQWWNETKDAPFIYASGLLTPPALNRGTPPQNYLKNGARYVGWAILSVEVASTIGSALFLRRNREKPAILSKQPPFLYLLLFGTCVTAFAILPFSLDEGLGFSKNELDKACISIPWLIAIGYNIMYQALACKLWRLNRLLQFRRQNCQNSTGVIADHWGPTCYDCDFVVMDLGRSTPLGKECY